MIHDGNVRYVCIYIYNQTKKNGTQKDPKRKRFRASKEGFLSIFSVWGEGMMWVWVQVLVTRSEIAKMVPEWEMLEVQFLVGGDLVNGTSCIFRDELRKLPSSSLHIISMSSSLLGFVACWLQIYSFPSSDGFLQLISRLVF